MTVYFHYPPALFPRNEHPCAYWTPEQDKTLWGNQNLLLLPHIEARFLSNPTP